MEQHACNTSQCLIDHYVTPWTVGLGAIATLLLVSTALGNALVCVAITREKRLQNNTNYFLMSLAVDDFMVALLVMPFGILNTVTGIFLLPTGFCVVDYHMNILLCSCSVVHLCTLSVDRYMSLRFPLNYGRNKTRRRVVLKISFVWIFSVLTSEPLVVLGSLGNTNYLKDGVCIIALNRQPCVNVMLSCLLLSYLLLMMIFHVLTIRLLKKVEATKSLRAVDNMPGKSRKLNGAINTIVDVESPMKQKVIEADAPVGMNAMSETPSCVEVITSTAVINSERIVSNIGRHQESEKRASKVLNIIFFTFYVLWAPYVLITIIASVCQTCIQKIPDSVFGLTIGLVYISSTANPVIYTIFNPTFRQAFAKLLNMRIT